MSHKIGLVLVTFFLLVGVLACKFGAPTTTPTVVPTQAAQAAPSPTPDHLPLRILMQSIQEPTAVPDIEWLYDSTIADSGSIEFAYQRECSAKKGYECVYGQASGFGIMVQHGEQLVVFLNKLAFDHRAILEGLPQFGYEDRWMWSFEDDVHDAVFGSHMPYNKHVIIVDAQSWATSEGAGWELIAYGCDVPAQRWVKLSPGDWERKE